MESLFRDVDLYNLCAEEAQTSFIAPTDKTVELLELWAANCNIEDSQISDHSSTSSFEETGIKRIIS
jgi:hypothetical protein